MTNIVGKAAGARQETAALCLESGCFLFFLPLEFGRLEAHMCDDSTCICAVGKGKRRGDGSGQRVGERKNSQWGYSECLGSVLAEGSEEATR